MKQRIVVSILAIILALFSSCNKTKTPQSDQIHGNAAEADKPPVAEKYGYVLRVNASFYTLENDTGSESDKTKWTASMALGEKVVIGKIRRVTFAGDGKVYDFLEIRRNDGKEGFAFASHIAEGGSLAVVIDEKAHMFSAPGTINVIAVILPRKTIAVSFPETERDGFVEIKAYDPVGQVTRQNYMRLSSLSGKESDIQSSILLQTAQALKNEGAEKIRRDALLDAALLDYPDSAFNAEIQALVTPNAAVTIIKEPVSHPVMTVNDDNVNVRDLPDSVVSKVIGKLNKGDEVTAIERTVSEHTIEGQRAHWYHITEPLEGWLFGAYLE